MPRDYWLRHGHAKRSTGWGDKTYKCWRNMISRCTYVKDSHYKYYGGRGIEVCDRWKVFDNFLADMGISPADSQIERIDNNGNYEPSNCKWATRKEQSRNNRGNTFIVAFGKRQTLIEWAEEYGMSYMCLIGRLGRGWEFERAITTPIKMAYSLARKEWYRKHNAALLKEE